MSAKNNAQYKDLDAFYRALKSLDLEQAHVMLVSGEDAALGDHISKGLQKHLKTRIGAYEHIVFSNETEEIERLHVEIANRPLFPSYRFLLVCQCEAIFHNFHTHTNKAMNFTRDLALLSARTFVLFLYQGKAPQHFVRMIAPHIHFLASKLYPEQKERTLREALRKRSIDLSQEALYYLLENLELGKGSIEQVLDRIESLWKSKDGMQQAGTKKTIGLQELRFILSSPTGWEPFLFVDALFASKLKEILRQYKLFVPSTDNFFALMKLILLRINEIRMAHISYAQSMSEQERIQFLTLQAKPPFIQKKILDRLRKEVPRFDSDRQIQVYDFLLEMQKQFRSHVPIHKQMLIFQQKSLQLFCPPASGFRETKLPKK